MKLGQEELEALVERVARGDARRRRSIEDLYPLSPLQKGLLFHVLHADGADMYLNQLSWVLEGPLDVTAVARAWQETVARHASLRTGFLWEGLEEPLQVVMRDAQLPIRSEDWREVPPSEFEARFAAWIDADRRQGFELERAPLLRLALLRIGERAWRFVLSYSHLVLDGWSMPLLVREVFSRYGAVQLGSARGWPEAPAYRGFIAWLQRQELGAAREFWRASLAGFTSPTQVGVDRGPVPGGVPVRRERRARLTSGQVAALQELSRRQKVTLSTCLHGGLGAAAAPPRRRGRRGVRQHRLRPSGDAAGGGGDHRDVHQHAAGARACCPREAAWASGCGSCRAGCWRCGSTTTARWWRCGAGARCRPGRRSSRRWWWWRTCRSGGALEGELGNGTGLELRDVRSFELDSFPLALIVDPHQGAGAAPLP